MEIFNYVAIAISITGSIIVIYGTTLTALLFFNAEWKKLLKKQETYAEDKIRHGFGSYLLLGLDFMLAADIIHTIHNPVLHELYILAIIVVIRSVISLFLHKEMDFAKK